jgi:hypothetical protein
MNEFEDLLRFLDTGLNREAPLLHPFDSSPPELSSPTLILHFYVEPFGEKSCR